MVLSRFPYGIDTPYIFGAAGGRFTTGKVLFVDSTTGSDTGNTGTDPFHPLATLDVATGKCTDSKGDIVYIMSGHTETITGAGGITFDKIGVTYIGLGGRTTKPTFLLDGADTVTVLVTAADVTIENLCFNAGHEDIVSGIITSAVGCTIRNCDFIENTTAENWLIAITVGVANSDSNDTLIEGCRFIMPDAADTQAIYIAKDMARVTIRNNYISGDFAASNGPIYCPATEVLTDPVVVGNLISNAAADTVFAINLAGTNVCGIVADNRSGDGDADGTPIIAAGTTAMCENFHTGVSATASGFIYPTRDT